MIVYCSDRSMRLPRRARKQAAHVSRLAKQQPFQSPRLDNIPSMCNNMFDAAKQRQEMMDSVISNIKTPGRVWLVY